MTTPGFNNIQKSKSFCDLLPPTYMLEKSFKINIPVCEEWKNYSLIPTNCNSWYTDRSRCNNQTGIGIYCPQTEREISYPLSQYATVFLVISGINGLVFLLVSLISEIMLSFSEVITRMWNSDYLIFVILTTKKIAFFRTF